MFFFKKLVFICLIILMSGCTSNNLEKIKNINNYSVEVETPNDDYNVYFKKDLKSFFHVNDSNLKYLLKTSITFKSTETLSVSGQNVLKSTKARIDYRLTNKNTNVILESGSFNTFPALSSSSNSLYTKEKSIEHIKERLTKSSAKSLYTRIIIIIRRLS